jgi:hypothetical protein
MAWGTETHAEAYSWIRDITRAMFIKGVQFRLKCNNPPAARVVNVYKLSTINVKQTLA